MKEFTINKNDSGQRLDKFIIKAVPSLPKSLLYKYIRLKRIKLNGKRCEISQILCEKDLLTLYINDEFFENKSENKKIGLNNTSSQLDIVYEDENIIIVYKPVGTDVHHGAQKTDDTLIDIIQAYLYRKGEYDPDKEISFSPALCNRIDRNTAGLVIAAKNAAALREINEKIRSREIKKQYLCICTGKLLQKHSIETAYHCKKNHNSVMISLKPENGYKKIITEYDIIKKKNDLMLVKVNLITGKTHQIRAHLSFLGAPLLGDGKYGNVKINKKYQVFTQQLCAYSITFDFKNSDMLDNLNGKTFTSPKTEFKIKL